MRSRVELVVPASSSQFKTGRIGQIAELPTLRRAHALGIGWAYAVSLEVRSSFVGCARTDPYSMPA
jgi:hypothetical protein